MRDGSGWQAWTVPEFYDDGVIHRESSWGALASLPGLDSLVSTAVDPLPTSRQAGGALWFDNVTGKRVGQVAIYVNTDELLRPSFGKSGGLGDIEVLCAPPPTAIPSASVTARSTPFATPTATSTPTATPSTTASPMPSSTATATPTPTMTSSATSTPIPKPIYLPVLLKTKPCVPASRSADFVLLLDTSNSMRETTRPNGPTKLDAARDAAKALVGQLYAGRDQAAVIQFNSAATVLTRLTPNPQAASAALDRLTQGAGTRIDLGIEAAHEELTSPRSRAANSSVLILLTDGAPSGTTPEAVRAVALRAKADRILVFTIGLGLDVDMGLLRDLASNPGWYYPAPDTRDLAAIYGRIAYEIPCKAEWP